MKSNTNTYVRNSYTHKQAKKEKRGVREERAGEEGG
jgi:hypothetical protein